MAPRTPSFRAAAPHGDAEPRHLPRRAVLDRLHILDTGREPAFDALTDSAAALLRCPMAAIGLIDGERQWFKACTGFEAREHPREWAFCNPLLHPGRDILTIPDTQRHPEFADNPLVSGPSGVRFYLGVPLELSSGERIGSLCVLDHEPRRPPDADAVSALRGLARTAVQLIEYRADAVELTRVQRRLALSDALGGIALEDMDTATAINRAAKVIGQDAGAAGVAIVLLTDNANEVEIAGRWRCESAELGAFCASLETSWPAASGDALGKAIAQQEVSIVENLADHDKTADSALLRTAADSGVRTLVTIPFEAVEQRFAVIIAFTDTPAEAPVLIAQRLDDLRSRLAALIQRKRFEDRQRFLNAVLDQAADALAVQQVDPENPSHRVLEYVNAAMTTMTGYDRCELLGQPVSILYPGDPAGESSRQALAEAVAAGRTTRTEVQNQRKDGDTFWIDLQLVPYRDGSGRVTRYISSARDISAQRALRQRLYERERQSRMLFQENPIPMWIYDAETYCIVDVNTAACQQYGYPRASFLNLRIQDLRPEREVQKLNAYLTRPRPALRDAGVWLHRRADGETLYARVVSHRLSEGVAGGILVAAIDVTREKVYEQHLEEARRRAEAASHAKSEFLANMSHELRTPLNAVIGMAQAMETGVFGEVQPQKYLDYIRDIRVSGQHLCGLIDRILDLAHIEAGRVPLAPEWIETAAFLDNVFSIVGNLAREKGLTLRREIHSGGERIFTDAQSLRQVLLNLLGNAVKFTDTGEIVVSVGRDPHDGGVRLMVRDTGSGMSAEMLARSFRAFATYDSKVRREGQGAGLGLPISRQLIAAQDGEIEIDSVIGHGTTVLIHLPPPNRIRDVVVAGEKCLSD